MHFCVYYTVYHNPSRQAITVMVSETIDPQRQEKAKEYARIRRLLLVVDLSLAAALLLLFIFSGASSILKEGITGLTEDDWAIVALYLAALFTLYSFLTLPLSYYSGFVLPHRYGLSTQTLRAWLWDQVKGGLLGLVLGTLVMEVIYYLLRAFPNHWWLLTGAFILFFTVVLSNLTPILIVPLFFKLTPASDEELVERLTRLAQRAGTQVQGVFTMDLSSKTKAANAALMGLGNTRRVVLGDTLYERYTPDEIGAILAHELGHHVHRDIWQGIILQTLGTLVGLYLVHLSLKWGAAYFAFEGPGDIAAFPLFALIMGAFGVISMPLGNTYSRWRERAADEYALRATEDPEAFISAMVKLANQNLADVDPEPWIEFVLYSHPAISKRIRHGEAFRAIKQKGEQKEKEVE